MTFGPLLTLEPLLVADSALYSAPNLMLMKELKWLCRVPLTVKQAKKLVDQLTEKEFVKSGLEGYYVAERTSSYGGIEQRWLVVESQARRQADIYRLEQKLDKAEKEANKKLQKLCTQKFDEPHGAIESAEQFNQKLKYHKLTDIQAVELRPYPRQKASVKANQSENTTYRIQANLVRDQSVIETERRRAGRFVLATNVIAFTELSNDQMLREYKGQQSAERGFS